MCKIEITQAIAEAEKACHPIEISFYIREMASVYGNHSCVRSACRKLGDLLIENGYELEDAVQICFGNFVVKRTPVEEFNFFYNKYSESPVQFEHDFLNGMLAVTKWFDLPVKGREDE
ncbi:hypothetical protein [Lysinibacillus piscis]|uniref:Uncharacterized protein n=1 Tax=Lysinibacillus piscis TaxID=2518931 RepID=A0ABQ5NIU6_9BACI|nr:hypothetical protein [Lysinibacillus sp. KH24]GLC88232.1 hypothetical protein LYSBPC_13590 [Lysinibacillus sp. KH24]